MDEQGQFDALTEGDDITALTALRELLVVKLMGTKGFGAAAVAREYRAVLDELRRLGADQEVSALDEIAARRAQRRAVGSAAPADPARPASG